MFKTHCSLEITHLKEKASSVSKEYYTGSTSVCLWLFLKKTCFPVIQKLTTLLEDPVLIDRVLFYTGGFAVLESAGDTSTFLSLYIHSGLQDRPQMSTLLRCREVVIKKKNKSFSYIVFVPVNMELISVFLWMSDTGFLRSWIWVLWESLPVLPDPGGDQS